MFAKRELAALVAWENDQLNRAHDGQNLKTFLTGRVIERKAAGEKGSYVLNIDAHWGEGKSYFLANFATMLKDDGFIVARVNAWQDDHASDPMIAVMSAIDDAIAPLVRDSKEQCESWNNVIQKSMRIATASAKGALIQLAKKAIGDGVDEVADELRIDNCVDGKEIAAAALQGIKSNEKGTYFAMLDEFRAVKTSITDFKNGISTLLGEICENDKVFMFVLIDELDRCRPTYALSLLERVKHLFDIEGVIFVVATDTSQLQHSVNAVYGERFDSQIYLKRFFDRTYKFSSVSIQDFVDHLCSSSGLDDANIYFPVDIRTYLFQIFTEFKMSLRDIEQIVDLIRSSKTMCHKELQLEGVVLVPMIIGYHLGLNPEFSDNFVNRIIELFNERGGNDKKIGIPFEGIDNYNNKKIDEVSSLMIFQKFITSYRDSLRGTIFNMDTRNIVDAWVQSRFMNEANTDYRDQASRQNETETVMKRYPELIKSAALFDQ